jgi:hypothetical protein
VLKKKPVQNKEAAEKKDKTSLKKDLEEIKSFLELILL